MYIPITTMSLLALCSSVVAERKLRGASADDSRPEGTVLKEELPADLTRELGGSQSEDITIYNGAWGSWKSWAKGGEDTYACGAQLRFENSQGGGDDTAANGLQLKFCDLHNWYDQYDHLVWGGSWGEWKGWTMCSDGKYMAAGRVRFEDRQGGGDDTALNGLEIYCIKPDWTNGEIRTVYPGLWGGWKPWHYKKYKLVKGAQVRFEDPQGGGDDTALNGIRFNVEKPF